MSQQLTWFAVIDCRCIEFDWLQNIADVMLWSATFKCTHWHCWYSKLRTRELSSDSCNATCVFSRGASMQPLMRNIPDRTWFWQPSALVEGAIRCETRSLKEAYFSDGSHCVVWFHTIRARSNGDIEASVQDHSKLLPTNISFFRRLWFLPPLLILMSTWVLQSVFTVYKRP